MTRHKTREGYSTYEAKRERSDEYGASVAKSDAGASVLYEYVDPLSVCFEWRYGELVRAVPLRDALRDAGMCVDRLRPSRYHHC
jgi:hypothetical protein